VGTIVFALPVIKKIFPCLFPLSKTEKRFRALEMRVEIAEKRALVAKEEQTSLEKRLIAVAKEKDILYKLFAPIVPKVDDAESQYADLKLKFERTKRELASFEDKQRPREEVRTLSVVAPETASSAERCRLTGSRSIKV